MSQVQEPETQPLSSNVKETIESILVAFILAFIFRSFVVEAFVIPTGSMAPTLLGAHMRFRCPDCGYVFDVNYSANSEDENVPTADRPSDDVYCPNCGYHVASGPIRDRLGRTLGGDGTGRPLDYPAGADLQDVHYGDRILVLKYAYLINDPQRWDVVVFKAPAEPSKYHYTENFIKRLVGKPGETLMALDGDIYIKDAAGNWQIQHKPWAAQEAMWRIIYDNDFYPQGLERSDRPHNWVQPWKIAGGDGWTLGRTAADGRTFRYSGTSSATIRFDPNANAATQTLNDYLVYDSGDRGQQRRPGGEFLEGGDRSRSPVSDLKLQMLYQRTSGQGPLKLLLTKRDHAFTAEVSDDSVTLWHTHPDGTTTDDAGPVKLSALGLDPQSPLWLQFSNTAYQVSLRINGKLVLQSGDQEYSADVPRLLREYAMETEPPGGPADIEVTAAGQVCDLSHVSLWHDVYYTDRGDLYWGTPNSPVTLHHQGDKRADGKGTYDDDEYFVMGDNSAVSADARYWNVDINLPAEDLRVQSGRVPGRFLLGKAFFVYWPAGYRPVAGFPALIPDFGDMRFIH